MADDSRGTAYRPLDLWPHKPADAFGLKPCQASLGKGIDYFSCTSRNTSAQQNHVCKGCSCSWRICTACSLQHDSSKEIRNIDPTIGLCDFHRDTEVTAIRPVQPEDIPYFKADLSILANRLEHSSDTESKEDYGAAPQVPTDYFPSQALKVKPSASVELLAEYLQVIRTFSPHRKNIIRYLGEGVSREKIAELLDSTHVSINSTILQMARIIGITDHRVGRKVDYFSDVMAEVHRYMVGGSEPSE